jgi:hypothetical protein
MYASAQNVLEQEEQMLPRIDQAGASFVGEEATGAAQGCWSVECRMTAPKLFTPLAPPKM